jgi:hypothetical protein
VVEIFYSHSVGLGEQRARVRLLEFRGTSLELTEQSVWEGVVGLNKLANLSLIRAHELWR